MVFDQKKILTKDGQELNLNIFKPADTDPSVIILGVHGFGEFGERYKKVAEFFTEQGAKFYIHDQRGHGLTPGKRGVIGSYDMFLSDIEHVIEEIKIEHGDKPIAIYGHSMGGNIALRYLMDKPDSNITSAIISSPWLKLYKNTPIFLIQMLEKILGPDFRVKAKIGSLSHDREHLLDMNVSGLYHNYISVMMAKGVMESGLFILNNPQLITTPVLLMSASMDNVVDISSIENLADSGNKNIEYVRWPDMFHELHNEMEREKVLEMTWDFIQRSLK